MKITRIYIKIVFLFITMQVCSQNLIPNPSFEETKWCSYYIGEFGRFVTNWSTPTWGTTDIFNSCTTGQTGIPNNYNGLQEPKDGKNYAGFFAYSDDNYREYIQVRLAKRLEIGVVYHFSFHINLAEKSDLAIKNIDFLFTDHQLNSTISRELSARQLKKLHIENYVMHRIENTKFYDNNSTWIKISKEFIATGNEEFLIIGNFNKNSKTDKLLVSYRNTYDVSYYYIDMLHLEQVHPVLLEKEEPVTVLKKDLKVQNLQKKYEFNEDYTFTAVTFKTNSSQLSGNAQKEIKDIYNYIKDYKHTKILISGHTDNVGSSEFNQLLSEKRARSVAYFFKSIGLDQDRISAVGYGNTQPIYSNKTIDGQLKNRRVSF